MLHWYTHSDIYKTGSNGRPNNPSKGVIHTKRNSENLKLYPNISLLCRKTLLKWKKLKSC